MHATSQVALQTGPKSSEPATETSGPGRRDRAGEGAFLWGGQSQVMETFGVEPSGFRPWEGVRCQHSYQLSLADSWPGDRWCCTVFYYSAKDEESRRDR